MAWDTAFLPMRKGSLRSHALFAFAALGGLYLFLLVAFTFMSYQMGREVVLQSVITREIGHVRDQLEAGVLPGDIKTALSTVYRGIEALPERYRENLDAFEEEEYDIPVREWREVFLAEIEHAGVPYFLLVEGWRIDDQGFVATSVARVILLLFLCSGLLAAWLSFVLASQLAEPVSTLAKRIRNYAIDRDPQPLESDVQDDDLRQLARAFDAYSVRLRAFIDREKEFTRNASHELRTPITVVRGACEVIRRESPEAGPRTRSAIARALEGLEEMEALVETFLLLAREERRPERLATAEVGRLVRRILERYRPLARPGVELRGEIAAEVLPDFPEALFRIAAENLVRNALLYTETGSVVVRIGVDRFEVEDTGPGIPESLQERLLEPLVRSQQSPGSGLGLSIVRRIAGRCDWQLCWSSSVGTGSRFAIEFRPPAPPRESGGDAIPFRASARTLTLTLVTRSDPVG